jgi:DNA polymerase (family 10)
VAEAGPALDNATVAERLETFASLLDLSGASYYSVRAYRRAAELIRATPAPVAELVRTGRVRELRGIGPAIEARLRELVETGRIAELEELEADVRPELVGLGRLAGLSPTRMVELGRALGVQSAAELRDAALAGRLREARGIGPSAEAKIVAALARERPAARRGLILNRARELVEPIAAAVGGVVAGDLRRARDLSERFAVVAPAASRGNRSNGSSEPAGSSRCWRRVSGGRSA